VPIVFLKVETEEGQLGFGAGSPVEPVTGESMASCVAALEAHRDVLVGQDVRRLPALVRKLEEELPKNAAARAALDIALHDLYAQGLELPLVEVLGRAHDRLPTSITIGIKDTLEESLEEAREYIGRGFRILKLKTGAAVEQDLETLAKIREGIGSEPVIRVDANLGYSAQDLEDFLAGSRKLGVEFVEQPLPTTSLEAQRALPEAARLFSAGDESIMVPANALACAVPPLPFGIFNIKLMKCGGVGPALEIANIARRAGVDLMWGCMDESVISISAALHAALASPATRYLDLDGSFDLARDLASGGFVLEDGMMSVTDAPGLGVRWNS